MITGTVNADREAVIKLKIVGTNGREEAIDAVVDTGFTGFLTLPPSLIASLGLPFQSHQQIILGDGNLYPVNVYTGSVEWEGRTRRIDIEEADTTPLVGMALMYGYKLTVEDRDGGSVTIELLQIS